MAKKRNETKKLVRWLVGIAVTAALGSVGVNNVDNIKNEISTQTVNSANTNVSADTPNEQQAGIVLTDNIRQQLGKNVKYNGTGAFIVNDNKTKLNTKVSSAPYATNEVDALGRPTVGNAWLNRTARQYKSREETGNGRTNWKPNGFFQQQNLPGRYRHAYDRGHLLAYALVGNIRGFDASEANPKNIATQTAWANEAASQNSTGQNYYEGLVRKALDRNKQVRYRVTNLYDGNNIIPSGAHLEAKSSDGSLEFNVFIPNVQTNINIDYATGRTTRK